MSKLSNLILVLLLGIFIFSCEEENLNPAQSPDCTDMAVLELEGIVRPDSGLDNGIVFFTHSDNSGEYLYSKNDTLYQEIGRFSNLQAGNYTFYLKNQDGCKSTLPVSLNPKPLFKLLKPVNGDTTGVEISLLYSVEYLTLDQNNYLQILLNGSEAGKITDSQHMLRLSDLPETWHQIKTVLYENNEQFQADSIRILAIDSIQQLRVINGEGGGEYRIDEQVSIISNPAPEYQEFKAWTGDVTYLLDPLAMSTIVTIPNQDLTVEATYANLSFELTVINGSGSGKYGIGEKVQIRAQPPPTGKQFSNWTGDTEVLNSITGLSHTFSMPAKNLTLRANYQDVVYQLTVQNGSGSGNYAFNKLVNIEADPPPEGKTFNSWIGATEYVRSPGSSSSLLEMPARNITVSATYRELSSTRYNLIVTNGTGDGSYTAGTRVTVVADPAPEDQEFDQWTGDHTFLSNRFNSTSILTIPEKHVSIIATYKEKTAITVSYSLDVKPILDAKCNTAGCHNGSSIYSDLTTYNNVKQYAEDIKLFVQDGRMPPTGKLPDAEIQKIITWIDEGANNN